MGAETARLVAEFETYLRERNLKLTRQRRVISEVFLGQVEGLDRGAGQER